ncbi:unnamed protein product [Rhizophagus irregularis]|nr:unnamed protein product [Rhizophagus irregularis]
MTSLNTKKSKVTKNQRPKRQSEEEKYKLREQIIRDDADRKKKFHLHSTNLTTSQGYYVHYIYIYIYIFIFIILGPTVPILSLGYIGNTMYCIFVYFTCNN